MPEPRRSGFSLLLPGIEGGGEAVERDRNCDIVLIAILEFHATRVGARTQLFCDVIGQGPPLAKHAFGKQRDLALSLVDADLLDLAAVDLCRRRARRAGSTGAVPIAG
jgi:hypothetical protein